MRVAMPINLRPQIVSDTKYLYAMPENLVGFAAREVNRIGKKLFDDFSRSRKIRKPCRELRRAALSDSFGDIGKRLAFERAAQIFVRDVDGIKTVAGAANCARSPVFRAKQEFASNLLRRHAVQLLADF